MNINHQVFQFNQITDLIYLGTNLCCTAIPHVKVLLDLGIKADIDLEEERQEQTPTVANGIEFEFFDKGRVISKNSNFVFAKVGGAPLFENEVRIFRYNST